MTISHKTAPRKQRIEQTQRLVVGTIFDVVARRKGHFSPFLHINREAFMHAFVWVGILLVALWAVLFLAFKIVSGIVHLVVLVGVVLLVWGLVKKGAKAVKNRV